jgi:hypothetical protein
VSAEKTPKAVDGKTPKKVPESIQEEYYEVLGEFMDMFATIEDGMNFILLDFLSRRLRWVGQEDDDRLLRAVLGGMRVAAMRDTLKRVLRVSDATEATREEVDKVLSHLGDIHWFRDRIAHCSADIEWHEGVWRYSFTNRYTVRELDQLDVIGFDLKHLRRMTYDLETIILRLLKVFNPEFLERANIEWRKDRPEDQSEFPSEAKLRRPWRYKPSELRKEGPRYDRSLRLRKLPLWPFPE